ncbi:hypothetical protein TTHERM_00151200 (macronuclear) [Tetrahymena thermophila SB210]|uniref:Uncharacterized protein n=1 Tax=Tetrahymena thermophila (strain SB210) TaxID=312017 RepID=I7MGF7_TETTS|nr:hypothetical protein TTHERM_00151200 [Tetrahymena thermophila SB210]EAS01410.2 hypothetical protein TTHERM_00151200 [Tetrahymena thermophila SB210]|eukprot:XP_001021656.2 hypothetical protein TTHERM_00151200 [Tetrahymena thermophila SB210]
MKQQQQSQYFISSAYLPTSADIVSTEATNHQNQNSNKSLNKFSHLNSLIEEFNKEFTQNHTIKNLNLNDSSRYSFMDTLGGNNLPTEPKEAEPKFYKTTTPTNSSQQRININNTQCNQQQINSSSNETTLVKQLQKNETLLNKAYDIINHFRTDLQMEQLTQQINNKIQLFNSNAINGVINSSSTPQNQQNFSQSFINFPQQNQSTIHQSNLCSIGPSSNNLIKKRNKSLCADCTINTTLPTRDIAYQSLNNTTIDLDLQDKLYQSNKNLQDNIIKLNEANKIIKQLQDQDIRNKEQIENYQKQHENMKQKLKMSLKKLKELKDRETQRESEICSIMHNFDNTQLIEEKRELERRLTATIKYNEDLFQNYSNILKINSELQNKILEYEQENLLITEQLKEFRGQMNILKQTEYKVEHLEHNISRIEETSTMTVPELQKKVKQVQDESNQKIEIVGYCIEFIEAQLNRAVGGLQRILQDSSIPLLGMKNYLIFNELSETANLTKGQDMKKIISKLDISQQLQQIIQYICTISYAVVQEQISNAINPLVQSIDRKILLVETVLPKLKNIILKQKAEIKALKQNASMQENDDLSSLFYKNKNQKNQQNQKNEFSKLQANSRQSLSFKKEQFDEFNYLNQENMGDFANINKYQKDQYQLDLINNSMSSNHLFKIHDSPDKKCHDEDLNLKLLQIINNGIKKYEDLSNQMNQLHQKLEITYKNLLQSNISEYHIKGELQKLTDTSINLSKNIELSELYIKKELGIIKAEIDYNLKLQRQMELPKMM